MSTFTYSSPLHFSDVIFTKSQFPYHSDSSPIESSSSLSKKQFSLPLLSPPSVEPASQPLIETHFKPPSPAASSSATSSSSPKNSAALSPPSVPPASLHPMVTRARNISKPREFTDGKIRYPIPSVLVLNPHQLRSSPLVTPLLSKIKK
jgi:hypothetical protein